MSLLRDFTAIQGIDVVLSPQISGTVNGIFENIPPEEFWSNLMKVYNLTWFFDGNVLYVYPGTEIKTEVIQMSLSEANSLKAIIGELDFASANTSLRYLPETKMLIASGPPRFMEVLHTFVDKIQLKTVQNLADETVVQIFPLKYAFAYDISLDVGSGNVSIEGVATLLQRILTGVNTIPQSTAAPMGFSTTTATPQPMEGVLQQKTGNQNQKIGQQIKAAAESKTTPQLTNETSEKQADSDSKTGAGFFSNKGKKADSERDRSEAPYITSITFDARLNAVIIRDRKDLMPFYQSLIERFDIPSRAIEIQVAIVDVDVGKSHRLGNDIMQFINGSKQLTIRPIGGDISNDDENASFFGNFTRVLKGYDIASRIQFLETASVAKTLSRPSILTLDNIAAVISQSNSTYVQVEGSFATDLFTVSASVALRVIPHIINIENPDGTLSYKIKLFVNIEDGTVLPNGGANGMPTVNNSQINTQSVLNEGDSLVVGGYYHESHTRTQSGIPVLKKLPLIGSMFRQSSRRAETMERLFIISPKIIELTPEEGKRYSKFFRPSELNGTPTMSPEEFSVRDKLPQMEEAKGEKKKHQSVRLEVVKDR